METLHDKRLAHMGLGDDEIVNVEIVIVFSVCDRALKDLADIECNALARELKISERCLNLLAADELGQEVELLRLNAHGAQNGLRLVILEIAGCFCLGHRQPRFDFLSAACPWNVRVGENSPNLWPIISSDTVTGMCLWPL